MLCLFPRHLCTICGLEKAYMRLFQPLLSSWTRKTWWNLNQTLTRYNTTHGCYELPECSDMYRVQHYTRCAWHWFIPCPITNIVLCSLVSQRSSEGSGTHSEVAELFLQRGQCREEGGWVHSCCVRFKEVRQTSWVLNVLPNEGLTNRRNQPADRSYCMAVIPQTEYETSLFLF